MEQFEVLFLDDDEKTVLDKQLVNKGEKVEYKGKIPEKAPENQVKYTFAGWINEEKMEAVNENLKLIAKYNSEVLMNPIEEAFYNASLENAKNTELNATVSAGQKLSGQMKILEKDSRTPEEIVNQIMQDGKIEISQEKNDVER